MIDIALCFDNNFVMQAGVFMTSLLMTNNASAISIHAISGNLSDKNQQLLINITQQFHSHIFFYKFDIKKIKSFPIGPKDHVSLAAYYRVFLPEILPNKLHKILYADCDTLVVDSLEELWHTDITNYSMAAIPDAYCNDSIKANRLGYSATENYYNSGILLINLDWWRSHNVTKNTTTFIITNPQLCLLHDQDALNSVLHGTIKALSAVYNIQDNFLLKDISSLPIKNTYIYNDIISCNESPCIIHFNGPLKPWTIECYHPYRELWLFFQSKTFWRNTQKTHAYKNIELYRWYRRKILEFLHILKPKTEMYKNVSNKLNYFTARYFHLDTMTSHN
ncbi:MAG: glycosyltransferase family 8 protein [Treponema sp.]|nr:glycosyltransferase family 8 protein [Treponema sp.]